MQVRKYMLVRKYILVRKYAIVQKYILVWKCFGKVRKYANVAGTDPEILKGGAQTKNITQKYWKGGHKSKSFKFKSKI